jgi:hypothetical protein
MGGLMELMELVGYTWTRGRRLIFCSLPAAVSTDWPTRGAVCPGQSLPPPPGSPHARAAAAVSAVRVDDRTGERKQRRRRDAHVRSDSGVSDVSCGLFGFLP